jgi:aryl-alcohol dehydrogenase-like predicted oxidoreductase
MTSGKTSTTAGCPRSRDRLSPDDGRHEAEGSLRRLGRDAIDVSQVRRVVNSDVPFEVSK